MSWKSPVSGWTEPTMRSRTVSCRWNMKRGWTGKERKWNWLPAKMPKHEFQCFCSAVISQRFLLMHAIFAQTQVLKNGNFFSLPNLSLVLARAVLLTVFSFLIICKILSEIFCRNFSFCWTCIKSLCVCVLYLKTWAFSHWCSVIFSLHPLSHLQKVCWSLVLYIKSLSSSLAPLVIFF